VEEFLSDTSEKEFRVRSKELKKTKGMTALKQKCKMLFVDYRNSGTVFHSCLIIVNNFKIFDN